MPRALPAAPLCIPLLCLLLSACAPAALTPPSEPATAAPPAAGKPAKPGAPARPAKPAPPAPPAAPAAPPAATTPASPAAIVAPAAPANYYDQARAAGRQILRIDSKNSLIAVTVRRGGALSRFGHDHVVASRNIEGQAVAPAAGQPGRTDFRFRLDEMIVDDSALRARAGLTSTPSDDAIAGTRSNMLTKALNAEKFPTVQISATSAAMSGPLQADITLHGVTRRYAIPAKLTANGAGLSASGALTIKQSDFGITPFAVLGGAIAVQDQLELRFDISATVGPTVSAPR